MMGMPTYVTALGYNSKRSEHVVRYALNGHPLSNLHSCCSQFSCIVVNYAKYSC